jgi:hypothetical protein
VKPKEFQEIAHSGGTVTFTVSTDDQGRRSYQIACTDAVAAFDTFVGRYAKQLLRRIPLRSGRQARLERMRFHNLQATAVELKAAFNIDILEDLNPEEAACATLMLYCSPIPAMCLFAAECYQR